MNNNDSVWNIYFSIDENYEDFVKYVTLIQTYIKTNESDFDLKEIEENQYFELNTDKVKNSIEFVKSWSEFQTELINRPELILKLFGFSVYQQIRSITDSSILDFIIYPRIINWDTFLVPLKNLKVSYYGKLVSFNGTILRVSEVQLICTRLTFRCDLCNEIQVCNQPDGTYKTPEFCTVSTCRNKSKFTPIFSCLSTKTIKYQTIRVRELITDEKFESGRVPRCIDCELIEDLVNSCVPGDDVIIIGIVKVRNFDEKGSSKKHNSVFDIFISVNSVINKQKPLISDFEYNADDNLAIRKIYSAPNVLKTLVHSVCPAIYGHEIIKAGLLLAIFGSASESADIRECIHVLLVGDPGLGKSKMLQACTDVAPRGVYICGTNSTNSGLTATLSKESGNEYAVTAGALVLADQGCCCIDEFDKMSAQHSSLLEVMEHQTVSIAKAGVVCSLPARSTIIAAANPVDGHYNKSKSVSDNLRMNPALLSRFDLIFILLDEPDKFTDCNLSNYILKRFPGSNFQSTSMKISDSSNNQRSDIDKSLIDRLKMDSCDLIDVIPQNLLRKYIAYSRKYIKPKLSEESITILKEFYLQLRENSQKEDMIPITTRQLESLIRLTKARAKIELRGITTELDAKDVVEIFQFTLHSNKTDVSDSIQNSRKKSTSGLNKKKMQHLLKLLEKKTELLGKTVLTYQEMKEVGNQCDYTFDKFQETIDFLNVSGFILKKGPDSYKILK